MTCHNERDDQECGVNNLVHIGGGNENPNDIYDDVDDRDEEEDDDDDDEEEEEEEKEEDLTEEEVLINKIYEGSLLMLDVPKEKLTHEVCIAFVARNGSNLRFVPDNIRCDEFDNEAVLNDSWSFGYLEDEMKTESLLLKCIKESDFIDIAMLGEEWAVPCKLLTDEVIRAAEVKFGVDQAEKWTSKRISAKRKRECDDDDDDDNNG